MSEGVTVEGYSEAEKKQLNVIFEQKESTDSFWKPSSKKSNKTFSNGAQQPPFLFLFSIDSYLFRRMRNTPESPALMDQVRTMLGSIPTSFEKVIIAETVNRECWEKREHWEFLIEDKIKVLWVDSTSPDNKLPDLLSMYQPENILAVLSERLKIRLNPASHIVEISNWIEAEKEEQLLKNICEVMVYGLSERQNKLAIMREKIQFLLDEELSESLF